VVAGAHPVVVGGSVVGLVVGVGRCVVELAGFLGGSLGVEGGGGTNVSGVRRFRRADRRVQPQEGALD